MTNHDNDQETTDDQPQHPQPRPGEWFVATAGPTAGSLWIFDPRPDLVSVSADPDPFPWRCIDTADSAPRGYAGSGRLGDEPGVAAANGLVRLTSTNSKAPTGLRLGAADKFLAWKRDRATAVVDPDLVHDATVDDVAEPEPKPSSVRRPSGVMANVAGDGFPGGGGGGGGVWSDLAEAREWAAWFAAEARHMTLKYLRMEQLAEVRLANRVKVKALADWAFAEAAHYRAERDAALAELEITKPIWPLDPKSPADLRRAADLLDYPQLDGLISSKYSRVAYLLRTEADRIDANAAEDGLVEKVARAITPVHCAWEDRTTEARAAIAAMREAGQ